MRPFALLFSLAVPALLLGAGVTVSFDPATPETGPFPTDALTVADSTQATGKRMAMPLPDCTAQPSTCGELRIINQLDGFSLNPRLRVKFSAAINVDTLKSGIHILTSDGESLAINQIVWDPTTNTAYAQPDNTLKSGQRYTLLVSDSVKDTQGDSVGASAAFTACLAASDAYCTALRTAVGSAGSVKAASIFTTASATRFLDQARLALPNTAPQVQANGAYTFRNLSAISWNQQTAVNTAAALNNQPLPIQPPLLTLLGFGRIAFGTFQSPSYLQASQTIAASPTAQPLPAPLSTNTIAFYAILPQTPPPTNGYPVVYAGHGIFDNIFGMPLGLAVTMVNRGYAVVTFSAVGHGYGPLSNVQLTDNQNNTIAVPFPGRAVNTDGNSQYDNGEGCLVIAAGAPYNIRDCLRQTALDYMQLTRALRAGVDLTGEGRPTLDGNNLNFVGQSLGSFYGAIVTGEEPNIGASALNVGGGSATLTARLSASFRQLAILYLGVRQPSQLNAFFDFNDNWPLRDQPVRVNTVPGALDIQDTFSRIEWIETPGAPYSYAPLFQPAAKRVLFQIALGDQTVPNPANSQLIRAANGLAQTSLYRHDLARKAAPDLGANPHTFLVNFAGSALPIAFAAQEQIALFFASGTTAIPDVNPLLAPYFPTSLFEEPPAALPEALNFLQ